MKQGHTLLRMASIAVFLAWQPADGAQILKDPTRPPVVAQPADPGEKPESSAVLQSVMIMPNTRFAIIGGEWVEVGGRYRDAQVVSITETEVVLRRAEGTESLKMFPGAEIKAANAVQQPASPEPARPRRRSRQ